MKTDLRRIYSVLHLGTIHRRRRSTKKMKKQACQAQSGRRLETTPINPRRSVRWWRWIRWCQDMSTSIVLRNGEREDRNATHWWMRSLFCVIERVIRTKFCTGGVPGLRTGVNRSGRMQQIINRGISPMRLRVDISHLNSVRE